MVETISSDRKRMDGRRIHVRLPEFVYNNNPMKENNLLLLVVVLDVDMEL